MEYSKKRGRNKIDIIHSVPYSKIIFIVASGENYPENVSKILKKDYSTIGKQMRQLHTKEYLISLKEEGGKKLQYNKTLYAVNLNKIIENIFDILNERLKRLSKDKATNKDTFDEVEISESLRYLNKKGYIESIKNNSYFKKILKEYLGLGSLFGEVSLRIALESLLKNLASYGYKITEEKSLLNAIDHVINVLEGYYFDKTKMGEFDELSDKLDDSVNLLNNLSIGKKIDKKFKEMINEDEELQELHNFLRIVKTSNSNLLLDFAYHCSEEVVKFSITKKHFENLYENEIKKHLK